VVELSFTLQSSIKQYHKQDRIDYWKKDLQNFMKKTIMIVEDNDNLREQLLKLIETTSDMQCMGAFPSAEAALIQVAKQYPNIILIDIKLPGMSGIECLTIVKKNVPTVLVIMVTVYEDNGLIFEALKAGANGYLIKSSPPVEMLETIRDTFNGNIPLSSPIALRVMEYFHKTGPTSKKAGDLSPRERQVLDLLVIGFTHKEIGIELDISVETVRSQVKRICQKLHARNRIEAIAK
jgi:DNA-binding NarL/FixJ family response regulator